MTTEHDEPPRLFESADDDLRAALGDAKGELPTEARLDAIFLKLPSGGGGGGGGEGTPPPLPPVAKFGVGGAALGLAGVAILGGAIYLGVHANAPAAAPSAPSSPIALARVEASAAPSADVTPSSVASVPAPSADPLRPSTTNAPGSTPTPSASSSAPARSESEILREAQANASSSPARAIALCDEHARLYPSGALSEEREFIRIQALMAAGRVGEARALADAFEARHPGSAHSLRLQEIVGKAKPASSTKP